ncbi:MAG: ABC transporter permease [Oligoflexia bacterium]|nr:MAG: ABC transporter permease [Oligoflexia bacterium]
MRQLKKILSLLTLTLFSLFAVFPIYVVLSTSFRGDNAFQSTSLEFWTKTSSISNYFSLFTSTDFLTWMRNSLWVSAAVTLIGVGFAIGAGYSLSRFPIRGKKTGLLILMTTQMFPCTMLLLPFYIVLSHLQLINSFWGLLIIYSATSLPFCIWQLKGFFDTIPKELEEAARLDGCSHFQVLYKVILPVSLPALAITSLFNFMTAWTEYAIAAVVLQDPQLYTLSIGLKTFQSSLATQWGLYAAAAIIVSVPVVILFMSLSKFLVSGLTMGSVKG